MKIKTKEQAGTTRAIAGIKRCAGTLTGLCVFAALFCAVGSAEAVLIQHLDATIPSSVLRSGATVTNWLDQSGNGNHALKKNGTVTYPSTNTFASGETGLKFGATGYSNLELFSATESDSWLNQTSKKGFCVLAAFKVDAIISNANDVVGNSSSTASGFGFRYDSSGVMSVYLGGVSLDKKYGKKTAAGDSMVYAFNYNAELGIYEFWDSKNYDSSVAKVAAADFSLSTPVTVGNANTSGRFLNGLAGEVKVYDTVLDATAFRAEREAMAEKWANLQALNAPISWRVIPADSDYPTDDVITAALSVGDGGFNNPLPANPSTTDCSATFQEAIDTVNQAGGGTVWVPEGEYRFDHNLILRDGVTLRGRWDRPSATGWNAGSVLKIFHGEGNADGDAFITTAEGTSSIKDLTFWHPNQSPATVKLYPYVIHCTTDMITLENITLVNAYRGVNQENSALGVIRGLYGTTLETGLVSDFGVAVPRFESLYSGPQYWEWWPLDNAVANAGQTGNYAYFMMNSGTFFRVRNMDVFTLYNADISGYSVGMVMENSDGSSLDDGNVPNHGEVSGVHIHDCKTALHVKVGSFSTGMNSTFSGSQYGIYTETDGEIPLTECSIGGGIYSVYSKTGSRFRLSAKSCTINGTVRFEDGELELKACNFTSAGTQITATSGIDRGIVWGCTYNTTQQVTIVGSPYMDDVDHTPLNYKPLPDYAIDPLADWNTVRKPAKTNLFNVTSYGATGDGITDDTTAVIAAINAAKSNGGGIVFFPFGQFGRYRITQNLNLGTGVELRGIGTRGHAKSGQWKGHTVILVEKSGAADGTPFITLGDGCGVRGGLVFFYPGNNWDRALNQGLDFVPYPYTIRAQGTGNYIIACTSPNPYQFADFDGAVDPLVDMVLVGGLRNVYRVGGGTTGCRIMTGHIKPSAMWGDLTDVPNNATNATLFGDETAKTLEVFDLNECEDITLVGMFSREAQKLLTCDEAEGRAISVAGEDLQNGFCFERAGSLPFDLIDTKPNMALPGDYTGKSGVLIEPTYNSTLNLFDGAEQGAADYKYKVLSGNIHVQGRKNVNSGWAQLRGIYVGGDAQLTLYDNILDTPFSLNVESNAVLHFDHSYFPAGIPYTTIDGSLVITNSDINENCILSVPGQTQFSEHGLILNRSNTTRVTNRWSYSEKLTSGDSFTLNVTEPAFSNSKVTSIAVEVGLYPGASGTNTVTVYYDSATGEKVGTIKTFTTLDGGLEVISFSKTDARFGSATCDIRIKLSDPAKAAGLSYVSIRGNPAIEPPVGLAARAAPGVISLDWKGKSHWQFGSYSVHRSTTSGGPYTQIASNVTATAFIDSSVTAGTTYYYVVKTVDSAGTATGPSGEVFAVAAAPLSCFTYTGGTGSWETSGSWAAAVTWGGPYTATALLPGSAADVTLGVANVTLSSTKTIDEYRIGDAGASPAGAGSLTLATGTTLNTSLGTIAYNRAGTVTIHAGATLNHSGKVTVAYRNTATVHVYGTMTAGTDLRLQSSLANARAYPSVIDVYNGGVIDVGGKLNIGGDDGGTYLGLDGTLNIYDGGFVKAGGWDLLKGAHVNIHAGGLLQIGGNQVAAANGYIAAGYLTGAYLVTYDAGLNVTYIDGSPSSVIAVEAESYEPDAMMGVSKQLTLDVGGGWNVGYIDDGDWVEYNIDVPTSGVYAVDLRVAANAAVGTYAGTINILANGVTVGTVDVPGTGGWQTWQTISTIVYLPTAGTQTVRLDFPDGGFNLNWFELDSSGSFEAENYSSMFGIQTQATTDIGGGLNVGWIGNGDWMEYNLDYVEAGTYRVAFRVAANTTVGALAGSININANNVQIGTINVYGTGGNQMWKTIETTVTFTTSGPAVLRLAVPDGGFNINWFVIY